VSVVVVAVVVMVVVVVVVVVVVMVVVIGVTVVHVVVHAVAVVVVLIPLKLTHVFTLYHMFCATNHITVPTDAIHSHLYPPPISIQPYTPILFPLPQSPYNHTIHSSFPFPHLETSPQVPMPRIGRKNANEEPWSTAVNTTTTTTTTTRTTEAPAAV
jgi:hypothetical protein